MSLVPLPVSAPSKSILSGMAYLVSGAGVLSPPLKSPISPVTSGITPSPLSITVVTMDSASLAPLFDAFELVSAESSDRPPPICWVTPCSDAASDELAASLHGVTQQMGGGLSEDSAETSSNASKSGASEALSIVTTVMESGLGVIPLVTGLIGLFSGGDSTPAPLTKYAMPDKIDFEGADTGSGTSDMDYDQMGTPRTYNGAPATASSASSSCPFGRN